MRVLPSRARRKMRFSCMQAILSVFMRVSLAGLSRREIRNCLSSWAFVGQQSVLRAQLATVKMDLVDWQRNTTGSNEYQINGNQFVSPAQLVTNQSVHTESPTSKGYKDRHLFCDCTRGGVHGFMVGTLDSSCHLRLREQSFLSKERTVRQRPGREPLNLKCLKWKVAECLKQEINSVTGSLRVVSGRVTAFYQTQQTQQKERD